MLPFISAFCAALGLLGLAQADAVQRRSTDQAIGKLYGYGTNISSMPLFAANGTAYLGNVTLSPFADASNLTFRYVAAEGEIVANHQLTNGSRTTTNSTDNYFSIDTSSGASNPVLMEDLFAEALYTTENFYIYGTQIMWRDPDATIAGSMESNFYAVQDEVDFLWKLYWDADGNAAQKGIVVVLKNVPL